MADVFISYSRRDGAFVQRLNHAFVAADRVVWVDWQNIPYGEDWWREITTGIESADTFIAIITEHWLSSEICHRELEYARQHNKRVLPLIRQQVQDDVEQRIKGQWMDQPYEQTARDNWEYLRHLNWVFFDDDGRFDSEFANLLVAIEEDQPHVKAHTRYQGRALEWERSGSNPSFLLRGDDLAFAERWLSTAAAENKTPAPTDNHRRHIVESRRYTDTEQAREAARERQIKRFRVAAIALGVVGAIALAAVGVAVPTSISAVNDNATSIAQIATATNALVTATSIAEQVATSQSELGTAVYDQSVAATQAAEAQTQVAVADVTLTVIAAEVVDAERERTIEVRRSAAIQQLNSGLSGSALRAVNALVADFPGAASAHMARGGVNQRLGNLEAAIEDYSRAIEIDPTFAEAYNVRAGLHEALGQLDDAEADYDRAIALNPETASLYNNRGFVHLQRGDLDAALADYSRAIELDPTEDNAFVSRAGIHIERGDLDAALADYNSAIAANPSNANALNSRAAVLTDLGDLDAALDDYNRAIDLEPRYAPFYSNRGSLYQRIGEYEAALEDYTQAIQFDPGNATAFSSRASIYSELGQIEDAIRDYSRAIELEPESENAYFSRGLLYYELGDYDAALADLDQLLQLAPDDLGTFLFRGIIRSELGDYGEAIADFEQVMALTPEGQFMPDAFINRGWVYYLQENFEAAIDDFSYVLSAVPDDLFALYNRGITHARLGEINRANLDYMFAIEVERQQQNILQGPLPVAGTVELALIDLNQAIEIDPDNPALYAFRGLMYAVTNQMALATADWQRTSELGGVLPATFRLYMGGIETGTETSNTTDVETNEE